jgi:hypothetical protein
MQYLWDYHPGITRNELAIFEEATGLNANCYQPLAVAHIDDLRYRFIANTVIAPSYTTEIVIIEIYKPWSGRPYITKVIPIDINL